MTQLTDNIGSLSQLRILIETMEKDLGLKELTQHERDVLYALRSLGGTSNEFVRTDAIREHELMQTMAQPTFYRALKRLLEKKILEMPKGSKSGAYRLSPDHSLLSKT